ncbi:MAG: DUF4296 domain-containing protein [Bacteroidota bacterium]
MKRLQIILLLLVFAISSCDKTPYEKPEALIKEKQMIKMMVDIHLAEATYNTLRHDSVVRSRTSADFYYSVLDKYQVPDSVFEQSFVYYASNPKNFEKMYRKVMNELNVLEQSFSGRKEDLLKFDEDIPR